jgi:lipopolysaccharide transport system ATP-binding protein
MNTVIKVENLSKAYQLGKIGTGTLSRDIERSWAKLRGREDPFLKIGESNDRTTKDTSSVVWSLKDIDFEINQGDAVGFIGRNGAGKSTLLKILSRITSPTTGSVKIKGRVVSLLEVGTGFHPELTGRENIFLNGAILGMRKKEINKKLDEIVDFAGIERYIDTPVKRYSSGMYVRLAFAVAAHLESEILIVDEVLAVGDSEFQKKCLGKMGEVSKGEGRTVLFVSHNMMNIKILCNKGFYLQNGTILNNLSIERAIELYFNNEIALNQFYPTERRGNQIIKVENIVINFATLITVGGNCSFNFKFSRSPLKVEQLRLDFRINSTQGNCVAWLSTDLYKYLIKKNEVSFNISKLPFNADKYTITYCLYVNNEESDWCQNAISFEVIEGLFYKSGVLPPIGQTNNLIEFTIC